MRIPVSLSIQGKQYYSGQDPEVIELLTDGTLEFVDGGWDICYAETEMTGMAGTCTKFRLEPGQVTLERNGRLRSQMVFREGMAHESLYQTEFGVMMLTVCAKQIEASVNAQGGTVDMVYSIAVENNEAGLVEYHLEINAK